MDNKIIIQGSNCKLTDPTHLELAKKNNIDFFPNSTVEEQKYVVASVSTSLYRAIYGGDELVKLKVTAVLGTETFRLLEKSHLYTTFRNKFSWDETKDMVEEIIREIIPKYKWITIEQYVNILKNGMSRDLTEYNSFCISNLKGWIEAYRIKYMDVIRKQRMYEVAKKESIYSNVNKVQKKQLKMRRFIKQLGALKILLLNPSLTNDVGENDKSELRNAFMKTLKLERHYQGYSLDIVFDYLSHEKKIDVKVEELVKEEAIEGADILDSAKINPTDEVKNNFRINLAKTNYILSFAKELINNNEVDEFITEFVDKYIPNK